MKEPLGKVQPRMLSRRFAERKTAGLMLALAVCLAAGCGFQLRAWDWAGQDLRIHVRADGGSALAAPLRQTLRQAGAPSSPSPAEADLVIRILNERRARRVASVAAGARAAEYELIASVQYSIRGGGKELLPPRWVEARRWFSIDRTSLAGSSEEQALIERELQAELVQHILRGLNVAVSAGQAPSSSPD